MTELLQQAFDQAANLAESEQDLLAQWLMTEIASERRWEQAFNSSQSQLDKMAAEALSEHRDGKTEPLDIDSE